MRRKRKQARLDAQSAAIEEFTLGTPAKRSNRMRSREDEEDCGNESDTNDQDDMNESASSSPQLSITTRSSTWWPTHQYSRVQSGIPPQRNYRAHPVSEWMYGYQPNSWVPPMMQMPMPSMIQVPPMMQRMMQQPPMQAPPVQLAHPSQEASPSTTKEANKENNTPSVKSERSKWHGSKLLWSLLRLRCLLYTWFSEDRRRCYWVLQRGCAPDQRWLFKKSSIESKQETADELQQGQAYLPALCHKTWKTSTSKWTWNDHSGTLHLILHESCLSTFRYNQNGIWRAWLCLTKWASSTLSRHLWTRLNNRESCHNMTKKLLVINSVNSVDFCFQSILFHKAYIFISDSIVISVSLS